MSYAMTRTVKGSFEDVIQRTIQALHSEGFGILCDIDVKATLKAKLGVDFRNYRILGACNPPFAYKVLQQEDKIGLLLPCNVIVHEKENETIEVAAIDPVEAMSVVNNPSLEKVAEEVKEKLQHVLEKL